jgi:hypothetical protein
MKRGIRRATLWLVLSGALCCRCDRDASSGASSGTPSATSGVGLAAVEALTAEFTAYVAWLRQGAPAHDGIEAVLDWQSAKITAELVDFERAGAQAKWLDAGRLRTKRLDSAVRAVLPSDVEALAELPRLPRWPKRPFRLHANLSDTLFRSSWNWKTRDEVLARSQAIRALAQRIAKLQELSGLPVTPDGLGARELRALPRWTEVPRGIVAASSAGILIGEDCSLEHGGTPCDLERWTLFDWHGRKQCEWRVEHPAGLEWLAFRLSGANELALEGRSGSVPARRSVHRATGAPANADCVGGDRPHTAWQSLAAGSQDLGSFVGQSAPVVCGRLGIEFSKDERLELKADEVFVIERHSKAGYDVRRLGDFTLTYSRFCATSDGRVVAAFAGETARNLVSTSPNRGLDWVGAPQ